MKKPATVATTLLFGAATAMTACSGGGAGSAGPAPLLQMESLTTPEKATPIPTPFATGRACNKPDATKIPGIYTWIVSYGNVVGHTYTQDNNNPDGYESAYEDWLYYPTPTPSPSVTPTATARPKPTPTASVSPTPFPTPTVKPTATPKPLYEKVTTYVGTYAMPGYDIEVDGSTYPVQRTAGCAQIVLFQAPNGTAGQARPRAEIERPDYDSYGGDNSMAFANEKPPTTVEIEDVYFGSIKSLSITNLTPDSGTATITLDNGKVGTMSITGSSTATIEYATEPAARPAIDSERAASLLKQFAPDLVP